MARETTKCCKLFSGNMKNLPTIVIKLLLALVCLYFFICSLDVLTSSCRLIAGKSAGKVFSNSQVMKNPIVGLMLGSLVTVLLQSSSTTTSIIVGLVAAQIIDVRQAIPMIMGANIGTSVTNTIVAMTQMKNREEFRRSFSCALLHDTFNLLNVVIFLSIETTTGFLYHVSYLIVKSFKISAMNKPPDLLKAITKPLSKLVIHLDSKILHGWSIGDPSYANFTSLLKSSCHRQIKNISETYQCGYIFAESNLSDLWIGIILLITSLLILIVCLIFLVKILKSLTEDKIIAITLKYLNSDVPKIPWITGYICILLGAVITFFVQSSSVFTSTLTPLVGSGLFTIERAYPLTLGSNIGTTTTSILAALASSGDRLEPALQISICHLFFNVFGTIVFYPIPQMRWPIPVARIMGDTVSKYRWFAGFYLVSFFIVIPIYIFGLSLVGTVAVYVGFFGPFLMAIIIIGINLLQHFHPSLLPKILQDWSFLPSYMRSLEPIDRFIFKRCTMCTSKEEFYSTSEMCKTNGVQMNSTLATVTTFNDKNQNEPNSVGVEISNRSYDDKNETENHDI